VGGILTWKDAVEYIMVGAHHVEICTAFFLKGFKIFREMVNGVKEFMEEKGYEKIEDMRGIALKHIRQFQELERVELHAEIYEEVCNACKKCVKSCVYGAIVYRAPETIAIDAQKCGGCGMCSEVCPVNAISMK
jgi:dihydropyrimidine dehydrogenase (NAD+) subunit PreA